MIFELVSLAIELYIQVQKKLSNIETRDKVIYRGRSKEEYDRALVKVDLNSPPSLVLIPRTQLEEQLLKVKQQSEAHKAKWGVTITNIRRRCI